MDRVRDDTSELVRGAWDIHVHAAPSLFPRWGDAFDLARVCADAGMKGIVLKAHEGSTVEVARLLCRAVPELEVHGGVVLNAFVGGLSPLAVELCIALGGRVVWMPTLHARCHAERLGLGGFSFQSRPLRHTPAAGYRITNDALELTRPVRDILALLHQKGVVLGTGHLAPDEIFALTRYVRDQRWEIPLLVNHACFTVPKLSAQQIRQLAGPAIFFELCYLTISPLVRAADASAVAGLIAALPEARWVLASDSGQDQNPPAPEALSLFAETLMAHGTPRATIARMLIEAPAALLAG